MIWRDNLTYRDNQNRIADQPRKKNLQPCARHRMSSRSGLRREMKYKDLPDGKAFQFSPKPGERETAIKAGAVAYSLRTGETLTIHPNRICEELKPLTGDGYRLGTLSSGRLVMFSQANDTQVFLHDFLVIGHAMHPKTAVKPVVGKFELREQQDLVDIILTRLEGHATQTEHLLSVLRDGLFQDFGKIKLT